MQVSEENLIALRGGNSNMHVRKGEYARAHHDRGYQAEAKEVGFEREGFHVRGTFHCGSTSGYFGVIIKADIEVNQSFVIHAITLPERNLFLSLS